MNDMVSEAISNYYRAQQQLTDATEWRKKQIAQQELFWTWGMGIMFILSICLIAGGAFLAVVPL